MSTSELFSAVARGEHSKLRALIASNCNVHEANNLGETALILAAKNGQEECMRLLVGAGCDIEHEDEDGNTAMTWAAFNGHDHCMQFLVKSGCNIDHANGDGDTALIVSAIKGNALQRTAAYGFSVESAVSQIRTGAFYSTLCDQIGPGWKHTQGMAIRIMHNCRLIEKKMHFQKM